MQHTFTIKSTSWAKLESSCQSKPDFENVVCRHAHVSDALCIFKLEIISPQKVCCIFHLSTWSFVMKFRNFICVCVCVCHLYKIPEKERDEYFLICSN